MTKLTLLVPVFFRPKPSDFDIVWSLCEDGQAVVHLAAELYISAFRYMTLFALVLLFELLSLCHLQGIVVVFRAVSTVHHASPDAAVRAHLNARQASAAGPTIRLQDSQLPQTG